MSAWDVAEPVERDWKEFAEQFDGHDSSQFDDAIRETECPKCGKWIGAIVVDGPDPVFIDLKCPRTDVCGEQWSERVR